MRSLLRTQTGSVTAELAVVLPSVLFVGAALIGGLVMATQKVQASFAAGSLARALARGESIDNLQKQLGVTTRIDHLDDFICVHAIAATEPIEIEEKSCARKLGL